MSTTTVLWQRLDEAGHDSARLSLESSGWRIGGTAIFASDGRPCRLDYVVLCERDWSTRSARVHGWVGEQSIDVELTVDGSRTWRMNGIECPGVRGCIDVDLHFTPATNTLPIRRLDLPLGGEAAVRAAWLAPDFSMKPLEQAYRRTGLQTYRYESDGGRFVAVLETNDDGLVVSYEGLWRRLA